MALQENQLPHMELRVRSFGPESSRILNVKLEVKLRINNLLILKTVNIVLMLGNIKDTVVITETLNIRSTKVIRY